MTPCPACDVAHSDDPLFCMAYGVALGAAFTDMHSITELMCKSHRTSYVLAMVKASVKANETSTAPDLPAESEGKASDE